MIANYCRWTPDRQGVTWCYTTVPSITTWEYCFQPLCGKHRKLVIMPDAIFTIAIKFDNLVIVELAYFNVLHH